MKRTLRKAPLSLAATLILLASFTPLGLAFFTNEITSSASLSYTNAAKGIATTALSSPPTFFTITGYNVVNSTMNVPTTAGGTAIPLGSVGTLGWSYFKNIDATNYVDIMTATSGTAYVRLLPHEFAMFRFTPAITAPAALAHTSSVLMQYMIIEN